MPIRSRTTRLAGPELTASRHLAPALVVAMLVCACSSNAGPEPRAARPDCVMLGDRPAEHALGVQARDGECLIVRQLDRAVDHTGSASPEAAVRDAGFGMDPLAVSSVAGREVTVLERAAGRLVGRYTATRLSDGSWYVSGVTASVPAD